MKKKIPSILVGVSGEYFVAAELSRRGYIASISMRNTRGIDILATNAEAMRSVTIQCKSNQDGGSSWILNEKAETFAPKNHFYVFVALTAPKILPRYHVVPASIVADYTKRYHEAYLQRGGKNSLMRNFSDKEGGYIDRWDLLGLDQ
jgi:hypothetical protein